MVVDLLSIFVIALITTLWSMRNYYKKSARKSKNEVKRGSIIILDDKVQHYQ